MNQIFHIVPSASATGCLVQAYASDPAQILRVNEDLATYPLEKDSKYYLGRTLKDYFLSDLCSTPLIDAIPTTKLQTIDDILKSNSPIYIWASHTVQDLLFLGFTFSVLLKDVSAERIYWLYASDADGKPTRELVGETRPSELSKFKAHSLNQKENLYAVQLFEWWLNVNLFGVKSDKALLDKNNTATQEFQQWLLKLVPALDSRYSEFDIMLINKLNLYVDNQEIRAASFIGDMLLTLSETPFRPSDQFIWKRLLRLSPDFIALSVESNSESIEAYRDYVIHYKQSQWNIPESTNYPHHENK